MNPVIQTPFAYKELRQMQEKDGCIKATISWPWNENTTDNLEALNDFASEQITGNSCALEDIGYRLVGADVDKQEVLIEVIGTVENYLAELEEEHGKTA